MRFGARSLSLATLAFAVCAAFGQAGTGFTISNGDTFFTQANSPTSGTATSVSGANLRFAGSTSTDHLFENWWWYRVEGVDTREFAFNNAVGTTVVGNTATTTWNFTNFSARLQYVVNDLGTNLGEVIETLTVTNTSATGGPIRLNLFNYADFDVNGTVGSDSATLIGADEMSITDGPWDLRFRGVGAGAYQVTTFPTLRGLLTNTAIDNLNNTGLPFGPGDFTGGFQWVLDLAPGQSATIVERLGTVPEPATLAVLGLGALALMRRRRK